MVYWKPHYSGVVPGVISFSSRMGNKGRKKRKRSHNSNVMARVKEHLGGLLGGGGNEEKGAWWTGTELYCKISWILDEITFSYLPFYEASLDFGRLLCPTSPSSSPGQDKWPTLNVRRYEYRSLDSNMRPQNPSMKFSELPNRNFSSISIFKDFP